MSSGRKGTPDILGDLMLSVSINIEQESNKAIKPVSALSIKEEQGNLAQESISNKAITIASNKEITKGIVENRKEKATFNLSVAMLESLEDAWMLLRRNNKLQDRIIKTSIAETALEIALADLEAKGELSLLYRKLKA